MNPPRKSLFVQRVVDGVSRKKLENTVRSLAAFPTRHTLSGEKGADAAALWIERELKSYGGRLSVERDTWTQPASARVPAPAKLTNVYATLPASDTAPWIVISGHYDSRVTDVLNATSPAPGANDDASGVAVVLEVARLLAGAKLPVNVLFAAVTGEEQSLLGSAHLAETFAKENRDVLAMATYDIVGNSRSETGKKDDRHLRVFAAGWEPGEDARFLRSRRANGVEGEVPARTLARHAADAVKRYVRGFSLTLTLRNDRFGRGGDHSSFLSAGFPSAVRFTEPGENWVHQHQDLRTENGKVYGDLPEFVDYRYLARVAQTAAAWVAELASAPLPPFRVRVKGDLSADTPLTWDESPAAAAYELLWRRTTDADWRGSQLVSPWPPPGGGKELVVKLSKDDFVFAIRAVGPDGARGLPTIAGR